MPWTIAKLRSAVHEPLQSAVAGGKHYLVFSVTLLLVACSDSKPMASPLPRFNADLKQTTISGLSSGAYLATQFQVAYSSIVKGAGIIAGGPYFCADGSIAKAAGTCTCTAQALTKCNIKEGNTDVLGRIAVTETYANRHLLDPTTNLGKQKVFMMSGSKDSVVPQAIMNDLYQYYRHYIQEGNLQYEKDIPAQHAIVTDGEGESCDHLGKPFINDCRYDTAGAILHQVYGEQLQAPSTDTPSGKLVQFDQGEFMADPESHSMDQTGWVYVPASCQRGEPCRVHIALHGCQQGQESVGHEFIEHAGYNAWADTNHLLVLYPQAVANLRLVNPLGCWNWWGYDSDADYATQNGRQMRAIRAMLDRLTSPAVVSELGKQDKGS